MRRSGRMLAFAMMFLSTTVFASPDPALWRRMVLLGANDSHYYAYVIENHYPGSYYSYSSRVAIEKYHIGTNRRVARIELMETDFRLPDSGQGVWARKHKQITGLNLGEYLAKEDVRHVMSRQPRPGMGVAYDNDGLYLAHAKKRLLLRKLGASKLVPDYRPGDTRLVAVYQAAGYVFIVIEQGLGTLDIDFIQKILPVKAARYRAVISKLYPPKKRQ